MEIRGMTMADCAEIGELYAASWKAGYKGLLPQKFLDGLSPKRYEERSLGNGFLDDGSFVILDGKKIVGHCHARPAAEEKMSGWGEIHTLYVLPEYWEKGFGSALFEFSVNWLSERGFREIYLYVLEGNERAARFYKKHGFSATDELLHCEVGGTVATDIRYIIKTEE